MPGLVLGSILSLVTAALIGIAHLRDQSRRLKIVLTGELKNLSRHCRASASGLQKGQRELILRIRMAKYGPILSLDEAMTKVGHLDDRIIERLIALSLRVRNNDIELDRAVELVSAGDENVDLRGLASRLSKVSKLSGVLARELEEIKIPLLWL